MSVSSYGNREVNETVNDEFSYIHSVVEEKCESSANLHFVLNLSIEGLR